MSLDHLMPQNSLQGCSPGDAAHRRRQQLQGWVPLFYESLEYDSLGALGHKKSVPGGVEPWWYRSKAWSAANFCIGRCNRCNRSQASNPVDPLPKLLQSGQEIPKM